MTRWKKKASFFKVDWRSHFVRLLTGTRFDLHKLILSVFPRGKVVVEANALWKYTWTIHVNTLGWAGGKKIKRLHNDRASTFSLYRGVLVSRKKSIFPSRLRRLDRKNSRRFEKIRVRDTRATRDRRGLNGQWDQYRDYILSWALRARSSRSRVAQSL